ncbi:MAG: ABC transporter permease [Bacteroidota bacterium]
MLKNNLKIAYRNILKNKTYSFIKISGFAIGIAAFIMILLFVQDELQYDRHYAQQDRIYRLLNVSTNPEFIQTQKESSTAVKWMSFAAEIKDVLDREYPEIEKSARMISRDWFLAGENQFRRADQTQSNFEENFMYADASLLDILEIPMLYGTQQEALSQPRSLVISKKIADKYFPNQDPVGERVILNENMEEAYTIGGVSENIIQSHVQYDFILTMEGEEFWPGEQTDWCCQNYDVLVRLYPNVDVAALEEKLLGVKEDYMIKYNLDTQNPLAEILQKYRTFELQPIGDAYLKSQGVFDSYQHGDIRVVRLFGAIAGFILLLACINFINLFTAKASNRAKEVGVRKVVGSVKSDLVRQFLTESSLYAAISIVIGAALSFFTLPFFNRLADKSLELPLLEWWFAPALLVLTLFIGLLAGTYPSFYLSAFKPIHVLKGELSRGSKNTRLRSTMVVFQFVVSIVLIISAVVVYSQMQFILNRKIGFDKEQVLMVQGASALGDRSEAFKQEVDRLLAVESVTSSSSFPVDGTMRNGNQWWIEGQQNVNQGVSGQNWRVADNYLSTMKMKIVEGRNFYEDSSADSISVIVNQTMVKKLGLDDPIGKQIRNFRPWNIIGVVEDFHYENMRAEIQPIVLFSRSDNSAIIAARINGNEMSKAVSEIENIWNEFMPNQGFRYTFLDESYAEMYEDTKRTGDIFAACAILAILIACLGLFALITFLAKQKSREIGIRKVLGASVSSLVSLLSIDFLKLVLLAFVIAAPIAWYAMNAWLDKFTYSIHIQWWVFALAGVAAIGIAFFTVSFQSVKAALANPVKSLRNE